MKYKLNRLPTGTTDVIVKGEVVGGIAPRLRPDERGILRKDGWDGWLGQPGTMGNRARRFDTRGEALDYVVNQPIVLTVGSTFGLLLRSCSA